MKEYVTNEDLHIINKILEHGSDVRIKRTSFHTIILDESVRVAKKKEHCANAKADK